MLPERHDVEVVLEPTGHLPGLAGLGPQLCQRVREKTLAYLSDRTGIEGRGPAFQPFLFAGYEVQAAERTSTRGLGAWRHRVRVLVDLP